MRGLPDQVARKLEAMFSGQDIAEVQKILLEELPEQPNERVLIWVIKLSEGSLPRLQYFARRACDFPGDVMWLAYNPEPYQRWPKPFKRMLQGGPVTITEHGPRTMEQEDDLWERNEIDGPMRCIVCGTKVRFGYAYLSQRRAPDVPWGSSRVPVHRECRAEGEALAHEQGYGWTAGPPW